MKRIAISNLCWQEQERQQALQLLSRLKIKNIELAITKEVGMWGSFSHKDVANLKEELKNNNLTTVSLQSLFYGLPYSVFHDEEKFIEHFKRVIEYSRILGNKYLVFGSPKNKKMRGMDINACNEKFIEVFSEIAQVDPETTIGIENTPKIYGADFLNTYDECLKIVKQIDKHNIVCHFDTACIENSGGEYEDIFSKQKDSIKMIHATTLNLNSVHKDKKLRSFVKRQLADTNIMVSLEALNLELNEIEKSLKMMLGGE